MADTVVALFDRRDEARSVRDNLIHAGFNDDDISLVGQPADAATTTRASAVKGGESFWEEVKEFFGFGHDADRVTYEEGVRRGGTFVAVNCPSDRIDEAVDIMMRHNAVDVDKRADEWRLQGWHGFQSKDEPLTARDVIVNSGSSGSAAQAGGAAQTQIRPAATDTSGTTAATSAMSATNTPATQPVAGASNTAQQAIPVVEEQLQVGKRQVRRGVRIYQRVVEQPVQKQVQLRDERVTVERRPVDRPAASAAGAFTDRTIEVTETHEEPVVQKQARVVEEVVVNRDVSQHTQTVRDTVRRTEVDVQPVQQASGGTDDDLRRQYETDFAGKGYTWEQCKPAYEFGRQLASDPSARGSDWTKLEADARTRFERAHPGSKWDQMKDAVHRSFDRAKAKV